MQKLLSICIPIYNRCSFFLNLVSNLLKFDRRLFNNFDIIIYDNNSLDRMEKFFKNLQLKENKFIKYYHNDKNISATRNLEKLIEPANTKYIWWLGDDDNLKKVLKNLLNNNNLSVIIIDRADYLGFTLYSSSFLRHFFKDSVKTLLLKGLNLIGPLSSLGFISTIVFKNKSYLEYLFDIFHKFKTSHSHIGYLITNFYNDKILYDVNNKIISNINQRSYEYEYNLEISKFFLPYYKYIDFDIKSALGVFYILCYLYLIKITKFSKENLFYGKELYSVNFGPQPLFIAGMYVLDNNKFHLDFFNLELTNKFYKKYNIPVNFFCYLYKYIPGRGQYAIFFTTLKIY